MEGRSLLTPRAPAGAVALGRDRRRLLRLERAVRELEAERDDLRVDLELARSWVRDLRAWIERGDARHEGRAKSTRREPGPLRRGVTIAVLVSAPWILIGGGFAAGHMLL